jgi:ATP-binding protein involved in chromosome partitioning
MSYFLCPHCEGRTDIFDHGGARHAAAQYQVPFLGEVPLDPKIRRGGDTGQPIIVAEPDSAHAASFRAMGAQLLATIATDPTAQRTRALIIDQE